MALDDISRLEFDIADREAGEIERTGGDIGGIPGNAFAGIGNAAEGGLRAAENIAKLDESTRQKEVAAKAAQEEKELLALGADGLAQYATEIGLDPTKYTNLAAMNKKPEGLLNLYKMAQIERGELDKKEGLATSEEEQRVLFEEIKTLEGIEDPAQHEKIINRLQTMVSGFKSEGSRKSGRSTVGGLLQDKLTRASTKDKKGGSKSIRSLRKDFNIENKFTDTILNQTSILRNAATRGAFVNDKGGVTRMGQDQALIMTFNKILDPTSVVRESEFARSGAAASAVDRVRGWAAKLVEGGSGLTNNGRAALLHMSEIIAEGAKIELFQRMGQYKKFGEIDEISDENLSLIGVPFEEYGEEFQVWKKDPKAWKKKLIADLNKRIKQVMGVLDKEIEISINPKTGEVLDKGKSPSGTNKFSNKNLPVASLEDL